MTLDDIVKNKPLHLQNIIVNLRQMIRSLDPSIEEHVYGGDKVKILLFHIGDKDNVLFGIQSTDKYALVYLHHSEQISTDDLKLEGNGQHAKHIKIFHAMDVKADKLIPVLKRILEIGRSQRELVPVSSEAKKEKPILKKITIENPKSIMRKKKPF